MIRISIKAVSSVLDRTASFLVWLSGSEGSVLHSETYQGRAFLA
jgi:hypothetical protein